MRATGEGLLRAAPRSRGARIARRSTPHRFRPAKSTSQRAASAALPISTIAVASADPAADLVTSRLSRLERRIEPLRDGDAALLATQDAFFSAGRLVLCELLPGVVERATELRARYDFKTPDALHVAKAISAISGRVPVMNDRRTFWGRAPHLLRVVSTYSRRGERQMAEGPASSSIHSVVYTAEMTKIEEWIAAKVDECGPSGSRGRAGVEELLRAMLFLEGKSSQIFGMSADRASMQQGNALRDACATAIRGWFDELGRSDVAAQVNLFEVATRHGLPLDLPEPASVASMRALERERAQALAQLGKPSETLPQVPLLASDLAQLRVLGERVSFRALAKYVRLPKPLSMTQFEWLPDAWSSVAQAGLDPAFLPIAGADGDYLGLVLDDGLLAAGQTPLVYYFHERDPVYTWVFESCASAVRVFQAAGAKEPPKSVSRGVEHENVKEFLREMSDPGDPQTVDNTRSLSRRWLWEGPLADDAAEVFESAGNSFAVRSLLAQRTWRELEERIRAARPARG